MTGEVLSRVEKEEEGVLKQKVSERATLCARYGMKPEGEPLNRRIVVSDEFYPLVAHGAIDVRRGGVKSVKGNLVTFTDGSEKAFDTVVLCTGYNIATHSSSHPYLSEHLEAKTKLDFYLGCFLPSLPKCSFVGGCFGFAAVPRIAELQAKAIVNVIAGVKALPSPEEQRKHVEKVLGYHVQKVWTRLSSPMARTQKSKCHHARVLPLSSPRRFSVFLQVCTPVCLPRLSCGVGTTTDEMDRWTPGASSCG